MAHLYYFSPFDFRFRSGTTLQETRNFTHLARLRNHVFFYGTYRDATSFDEVKQYIGDAPVTLDAKRSRGKLDAMSNLEYLARIARDHSPNKIVIGRHVRRTDILLRLRPLLGNPVILHELHERALPHLLTEDVKKRAALRQLTERVFAGIDGLFLTNYSQEILLKQEFSSPPPYGIFPHAAEAERFAGAVSNLDVPGKDAGDVPYVVTFMGHFPAWRDFEMLFQAMAKLTPRFSLRIAGGISSRAEDSESQATIDELTTRYGLGGRVDYRGHVSPARLTPDVLNGSSVLVLPLGDNLSARYFTCPIKLLEYMSTQIPVVAVNFPSVSLITGHDSVFLTGNEAGAFARAIERAVTAPDRAGMNPANERDSQTTIIRSAGAAGRCLVPGTGGGAQGATVGLIFGKDHAACEGRAEGREGEMTMKNDGALTDKAFWDSGWEKRKKARHANEKKYLDYRMMRYFDAHLTKGTCTALEVGAADSIWLEYMAQRYGYRVVGLDYSRVGCELVRENLAREAERALVIEGDMFHPSFENGTFDVVFSSGLVEHFTNYREVLAMFRGWLKPRGNLITFVPNKRYFFRHVEQRLAQEVYDAHMLFQPSDLAEAYRAAGLDHVQAGYLGSFSTWKYTRYTRGLGRFASRVASRIFNDSVQTVLRTMNLEPETEMFSPWITAVGQAPG